METSQTPHVTPFKTDNTKRRTDINLFVCLFLWPAFTEFFPDLEKGI